VAWRFWRQHFHKKLLMDLATSLHPPSETTSCTRLRYPVDLYRERIDCANLGHPDYEAALLAELHLGVFVQPMVRFHSGEYISLLAGWTSHRSLVASQLFHTYDNPAWRTCCFFDDILNEPRWLPLYTAVLRRQCGRLLRIVLTLSLSFLYQNQLEIYIPKPQRPGYVPGLEADLDC
jgi:hypothetical protein